MVFIEGGEDKGYTQVVSFSDTVNVTQLKKSFPNINEARQVKAFS